MPKRKPSASFEAIVPSLPESIGAEAPTSAAMSTAGGNADLHEGVSGQMTVTVTEAVSASLLRVARSLKERGLIHQAVATYLKIIVRYAHSQEASIAVDKVLAIVDGLRLRGQHQSAMTVLDRLEAVRVAD